MLVFVDTSAWISLYKRKDPHHDAVREAFQRLVLDSVGLVTSSDVLDETYTRLRYDAGHRHALDFGSYIRDALQARLLVLRWVNEEISQAAWEIFEKYSDHTLSMIDCTSAVIARTDRVSAVLTLDRDFEILGFAVLPSPSPEH